MYAVRLRHDHGTHTILTCAQDGTTAVELVLTAQLAPARAVIWVAAQPICEYCDRPATRRVRDNGEHVCRTCARAHTSGPLRDYVTNLAATQWPRLNPVTHLCADQCADAAHPRDGREITRWEK
jgi:hypothetical protein